MILDTIKEDLNTALKERDTLKVSVLRMVLSEFKNMEIELRPKGEEFSDEAGLKVLQKEAKKRKESIETFAQAGRDEMAEQERQELAILESYLPAQMSAEEIEKLVDDVVNELDDAEFGQVMGAVMQRTKGQADGKIVNEIVRNKLNS